MTPECPRCLDRGTIRGEAQHGLWHVTCEDYTGGTVAAATRAEAAAAWRAQGGAPLAHVLPVYVRVACPECTPDLTPAVRLALDLYGTSTPQRVLPEIIHRADGTDRYRLTVRGLADYQLAELRSIDGARREEEHPQRDRGAIRDIRRHEVWDTCDVEVRGEVVMVRHLVAATTTAAMYCGVCRRNTRRLLVHSRPRPCPHQEAP